VNRKQLDADASRLAMKSVVQTARARMRLGSPHFQIDRDDWQPWYPFIFRYLAFQNMFYYQNAKNQAMQRFSIFELSSLNESVPRLLIGKLGHIGLVHLVD